MLRSLIDQYPYISMVSIPLSYRSVGQLLYKSLV